MTSSVTARRARPCKRWLKLLSLLTLAGVSPCIFFASNALAEQLEPEGPRVGTGSPNGTIAPIQSGAPSPEPRRFALTFNPLNLIIGRYGFNFEYQPVPHHGLIVSPHYDYYSENPQGDYGYAFVDTLNGVGAELGYRFYSGKRGFEGFFAGPSLLLATNRVTTTGSFSGPPVKTNDTWSSVGVAFDVGGPLQLGHFIIGGGAGVRYTKLNQNLNEHGLGDMPVIEEVNAGGGWCPRLAFNLGYAF
jgi:hypothetical protein